MGPDGVVSWGDDLSRGTGGALELVTEGSYALRLFSARPSDSGVYRCAVSVYAGRKNPAPSAPATFSQRSEGVSVNLKTKGKGWPTWRTTGWSPHSPCCNAPKGLIFSNISNSTTFGSLSGQGHGILVLT